MIGNGTQIAEKADRSQEDTMTTDSDGALHALIRLIPPARALKEDLENSINLELHAGSGDLAVRILNGLQASVFRFTNDPYVETLALDPIEAADDKQKVAQALLAVGQLVAYLEGKAGLVGSGERSGSYHVQTAPTTNISFMAGNTNLNGVPPETIDKAMSTFEEALKGQQVAEEQEEEVDE